MSTSQTVRVSPTWATSTPHSDLLLRPAVELVGLLADRLLGARELLAATREQLEAVNPDLNAVVTVDWERAEAEAAAADDRAAGGRAGQSLGALHGLPMTVKDSIETAGLRTTCGDPGLRGHVPQRDAVAVQRLRAAGAIVYGKSNVPTMASDSQTYNPVFGTTRNPWDRDRTPGGSSGGAAVAVATGMSTLETGSDLGGSIRIPAHFCGVYGLKPSVGLIPLRGHIPPAPGALVEVEMAVLGPLARSADDLALALSVLAGPDQPASTAWRLALPAPRASRLRDYRVGVWFGDPACPVDNDTTTALEELASELRSAGVRVVEVASSAPSLGEGLRLFRRLAQYLAGATMSPDELASLTAEEPSEWQRNVTMSACDLWMAREERAEYAARWARLFLDVDVVLTPTMPTPAHPHDHDPDVSARRISVDGESRAYGEQYAWLQAPSAAYLPVAVAPIGMAHGLPLGVQIIGPYLEDRTVLDVAGRLAQLR